MERIPIMVSRAPLLLVVVLGVGSAAACAGNGAEARQADVSPGQVVHSPAIPDRAGAARVVKDWLITIQDIGFKDACRFMTPDFQRQMPAYNCGDPNVADSPPFMIIDYRVADVRVPSHDGDSAVVDVTLPHGQAPPATYSAHYDHTENRWLVAGHGVVQR